MTRTRVLGGLLVALIVGGVLWELPAEVQPESWRRAAAERKLESDDDLTRLEGVRELAPLDPRPSLPHLMKCLCDKDYEVRRAAIPLVARCGAGAMPAVLPLLDVKESWIRDSAYEVLIALGPIAAPHAPRLARIVAFDDQSVGYWDAIRALAATGPAGLEALAAVVNEKADRTRTVQAFGQFGAPAVPALRRFLDDDRERVREIAVDALVRQGDAVLPVVRAALSSTKASTRESAIDVARGLGRAAAPLVPRLTELLDDPEVSIRSTAATTLGMIGSSAAAAVPVLARHLTDRPRVAFACLGALEALKSLAAPAAPAVIEAMKTEDVVMIDLCAQTLVAIDAAAAIAPLEQLTHHADEGTRKRAQAHLETLRR